MMGLTELVAGGVFTVMLIFMRFGTALMLMPGFGDSFIPAQYRFYLAIGLSFILAPVLGTYLPPEPSSFAAFATLVLMEVGLGLFIGTVARLFLGALEICGSIVSMQIGLSSASMFNPQMATQSTAIGTFLSLTGVMIIFATNLHHMLLQAILGSYQFFPPGIVPDTGDLAGTVTTLTAEIFTLGFQLSAPFLILGFVFFWGLGLLARLMPQIQVFLIALPVQILVGLFIFGVAFSIIMTVWLEHFAGHFISILRTGS